MLDRRPLLLVTLALIFHFVPAQAVIADTFFVDNLNSGGDGSLREAINDANFTPGADTILFSAGLSGTISLESGLPRILESVDIFGPAADVITVDAQQNDRVLYFSGTDQSVYSVQGLTLTGGQAPSGGGGGISLAAGQLTLEGVRVVHSSAVPSGCGGGIFASPDTALTLRRSVVAHNEAGGSGGGICGRTITLEQSAIYDNVANGSGGGVWSSVELTVFETTISGNLATLELPSLGSGGGIYVLSGTLLMYQSTVTGNVARIGPGLRMDFTSTVTALAGSVIAGNRFEGSLSEGNCGGDLGQPDSNNLSGDDSCGFTGASDLENTDPRLAPLSTPGARHRVTYRFSIAR